ncbi:MAG: baseplate J/gp47 family protein [Spirochaetales bacterium]|jgi:hypothetical protein|nr:baseplate J/gp47 family protein [Spirochaetales bacterium]
MPFKRDPLAAILDRAYANYTSLFKPLDKTPRHNLLRVFASADAGMYHQLLGDLDFLADQIFPDTATGEYLRQHWSDRVPPLYATSATGTIVITGAPNAAVPAGLVFSSAAGQRYFTESAYRIGAEGSVSVIVKAEASGAETNLGPDQPLTLISSIPVGIDSAASTSGGGISGGADGETDEAYLARVLQALRNSTRYGKPGDFAAWAMDASPEVSKAWEFKNFGVFGALLIQCIHGNQFDGVAPVGSLSLVTNYISAVAPPVLFTVRTPEIVSIDPEIALLPGEDTLQNRDTAAARLKTYLQATAAPGGGYTAGNLRDAIIDGVTITAAAVKIDGSAGGRVETTILQYPVVGDITWE